MLQILAPNEAVVAVSMEVRIGERSGMMNIGVPSMIVKMLRQRFDQQWSVRKTESTEAEQARVLSLVKAANVRIDARLEGPTLTVGDLMALKPGDVLAFDYPVHRELDLSLNGKIKFRGGIGCSGRKRAFFVQESFSQ